VRSSYCRLPMPRNSYSLPRFVRSSDSWLIWTLSRFCAIGHDNGITCSSQGPHRDFSFSLLRDGLAFATTFGFSFVRGFGVFWILLCVILLFSFFAIASIAFFFCWLISSIFFWRSMSFNFCMCSLHQQLNERPRSTIHPDSVRFV